jgi:DNA-binding CsgD family transcriptional regulator
MSAAFRMNHIMVTGDMSDWDVGAAVAALARASALPVPAVLQAQIALWAGRREEAATCYEQLRGRLDRPDFAALWPVLVHMVPLVEEFGDGPAARRLSDLLAPYGSATLGAEVYGTGSLARLRGRLAVVQNRSADAVDLFEQALAVDAQTGARPYVVLDRISLAGALLTRAASGDTTRALQLARAAADEARRLGMPGPLRTAGELSDRAGAALRAADPLTEREREITGLVAEALTNRQIAERLFLSERTVETHVRHILGKLGLTNRTELATMTLGSNEPTAARRPRATTGGRSGRSAR